MTLLEARMDLALRFETLAICAALAFVAAVTLGMF